jgi:hypothetical protein
MGPIAVLDAVEKRKPAVPGENQIPIPQLSTVTIAILSPLGSAVNLAQYVNR